MNLNAESNKAAAVAAARQFMEHRYRPGKSSLSAACLYWAYVTVGVLRDYGYNALLQAGTLNWPRLRPDQDDELPSTLTQFSYEWEYSTIEAAMLVVDTGVMPEMHCWAAILEGEVVVDLTTGYLVQQCAELTGLDWPGDLPPEYVWESGAGLRERCICYSPNLDAIKVASTMLDESLEAVFGSRPNFECPLLTGFTHRYKRIGGSKPRRRKTL